MSERQHDNNSLIYEDKSKVKTVIVNVVPKKKK